MEATPREAFAPYRFRDLANRNLSCRSAAGRPCRAGRSCPAARGAQGRPRPSGAGGRGGVGLWRGGAGAARTRGRQPRAVRDARDRSLARACRPWRGQARYFRRRSRPPRELGRSIGSSCRPRSAPRRRRSSNCSRRAESCSLPAERRRRCAAAERLIKLDRNEEGELRETDLGPCRLGPAIPGLAQAL